MEDPLTISVADHFHLQLDSDFSAFSFPNAFPGYPGPDTLEPSYLSGHQLGYQMDNRMDNRMDDMAHPLRDSLDYQESSHDDLNQFFTGSPFSNPMQSPTPVPRYAALKSHGTLGGYSPSAWERSIVNSTPDPWVAPAPTSSLAIITAGLERTDSHETVLMHGQVTPGDSPASPSNPTKPQPQQQQQQRKTPRKSKSSSTLARRKSESSSASESQRASPIRKRKPRKSSKKTPTAEQEAQKRETFLKRNREAAYKCRVKKKSQTEMIMERVKILDADNAVKGLEVEQLRREIEGLRALLLPHYRGCGDERLVRFMDGMAARGAVRGADGQAAGYAEAASPGGEACGGRRASEAVFEMGGFEESMGMAGGVGGTSISSASMAGSRPQSREGEGVYGGFERRAGSPLLDLDGMESM